VSKPAIFTRRLNVFDFCRFWVLSRVNDSDIYYNERYVTRPALWLALRCRRFHAAHLDFNKKDKDGFGLLYGFQENINIILAEVLESAQSLPDWLKTSLFWEARSLLEYEIVFIESALHRAAALKLENIVLYGVSNPFFRETQGVYALKGISIRALTRFPAIWKILATPFVSYCMKRSSTKAGSDRPAVWMEYAKLGVHTNAFWRKYIINGDFESVYYLDRADTPVIPEVTRTIESDRVDWIDSHAPKLLGMSGQGIAQLLKLLGSSLSLPR